MVPALSTATTTDTGSSVYIPPEWNNSLLPIRPIKLDAKIPYDPGNQLSDHPLPALQASLSATTYPIASAGEGHSKIPQNGFIQRVVELQAEVNQLRQQAMPPAYSS
jgi:hypothetical protein